MQSLSNTAVSALFDAASSTNPTPGGGCISAIGGYLGVALLLKAIRISARRQPTETVYAEVEQQLLALAARLMQSAQFDSDAFGFYIRALQLPKGSDVEKLTRRKALQDASVAATEVALDILDLGNTVLQCAAQVHEKVLPTILADVRASVEFVSAMNLVARENAQANLSGLALGGTLRERLSEAVAQHAILAATFK
jgi:formiminotetrahydrofolate cyclodeaminase